MEQDVKANSLSYNKGLWKTKNVYGMDDNCLGDVRGVVWDSDGLRAIQHPSAVTGIGNGMTLLYVHRTPDDDKDRLLEYEVGPRGLYYIKWKHPDDSGWTMLGQLHSAPTDVCSVGRTLLLNDGSEIHYYLWKNDTGSAGGYLYLGTELPDVTVSFRLSSPEEIPADRRSLKYVNADGLVSGLAGPGHIEDIIYDGVTYSCYKPEIYEDEKQAFNDLINGLVTSGWADLRKKKRFAFPFFATWALRLYDGSHVQYGSPVLLFPSVRSNYAIYSAQKDGDPSEPIDGSGDFVRRFGYSPHGSRLVYTVSGDAPTLSAWSDIIKCVDIFVSEDVKSIKPDGRYVFAYSIIYKPVDITSYYFDFDTKALIPGTADVFDGHYHTWHPQDVPELDRPPLLVLPERRSDLDIINELKQRGVYYKLFEIPTEKIVYDTEQYADDKMEDSTLDTLTARERLESDYFGRAPLHPRWTDNYNNRVHAQDVRRGFFGGYRQFTERLSAVSEAFDILIELNTDSGLRVVKTEGVTLYRDPSLYYYYPDPRVRRVWFVNDNHTYRVTCEEHSQQNGSIYLEHLPSSGDPVPADIVTTDTPPSVNIMEEYLWNHVMVSESGNPFVWRAEGDVSVSSRRVLGVAMNVVALNELEFGRHQLIVFTEEGIWALKTNKDGLYDGADPLSRDVLSDHHLICETDHSVYFGTKRGLMRLSGRDIRLVSGQLGDSWALGLSATTQIAYDYRDQKLWLFDCDSTLVSVLHIPDGTWWQYESDEALHVAVRSYPDTLLQRVSTGTDGEVLTLYGRPAQESDDHAYEGYWVTQPLKLGAQLDMKSIRQMRHLYTGGVVRLTLWGSDDAQTWRQLHSTRGKGWRYYRMRLTWTGMSASDRYAQTVLLTQKRRTERV